ncbi:aminodeoxychorismate synthase component I [Marixanthomonas sp. SCSIO 43207]|uniref:aminodeoxychorismate synthase component I n=1 Tax=Marixanthomonas sp. SCSIO 43207 TaxID=2779360 RepID=UPI001CAA3997|nr:aminodeoxychorismate synthase component I [Marixanthomonas sp. SCSIO 43207]UAB80461.1 aminodeoxychorismate synthase component I [Marixanthomonas sp. SCSIO 43207]
MRTTQKKRITSLNEIKPRILSWAQQFEEVVWLDSNAFNDNYSSFKAVLAVDAFTAIKTDSYQAFDKLEEYQTTTKDWLFGYLTYDLKNDVEKLSSINFDGLHFPDLQFFQPKKIFFFSDSEVEIQYLNMVDDEVDSDWETILQMSPFKTTTNTKEIKIRLRTSKDSYFDKVEQMLKHIERGDIYEANFCQEFFAEKTAIDPLSVFNHLNEISQSPFASFLKFDAHYALSASPERYLKKTGNIVVSQPIKGTAKRLPTVSEDKQMIEQLENDPKERSENIMITDLVRNDLSRIAKKGTVTVEELCKIYTFEQVHQMISTIRCEVKDTVSSVEIIKNSFPMGSMTGAPKVSAMKIIEELEDAKRGLYSGAVGYFTPNGDFDFNVVIRSILYNTANKYVSFSVGGAITAKSIVENEYEECLLKAKAMRTVLET